MKTPWAKFITSIRPKTSVRPEAMMKIIMPMARPATVSVTQVGRLADQRQRGERDARGRAASGIASRLRRRVVHWCESSDRPSSLCCSAAVGGERGHAPGVHDAAGVHHRDRVAQRPREVEVLLHHQDGGVGALQFAERLDHVGDDRGRESLGRLVDQQQLARLDDGARDRQHLLLPAGEVAGERSSRRSSAPGRGRRSTPGAWPPARPRAPRAAGSRAP